MATVNKDFKIKSGLIVEGTTATVNGYDILTKKPADDQYIIGLIGGSATSEATPDTVVLRDGNADFAAHYVTADLFIGDLDGQAATVDSLSGHTTTEISEGNNLYFTNQRALDATSAAYDPAGSAATAQNNAEDYADGVAGTAEQNAKNYADGLAVNYDPAGSAATAEDNANSYTDNAIINLDLANTYDALGAATNAQNAAATYTDNAINALTTSDIEEGTNSYFTDARAKTSAADLLTGANLTNITITGSGSGLTITAENGVADSTTDDLDEGANNLYFTDARAVSAVSGANITPNTVTIDTYRKEEATQQYVATASTVDVHALSYPYGSAKYLVRVVGSVNGILHSQVSEILMTVDGNDNIAITEYGTIYTSASPLASFSARVDQTNSTMYVLTATTAANGLEVVAAATMLSWAD